MARKKKIPGKVRRKKRSDIVSVCGWCRKKWKDQSNFWHKSDIDTTKYIEANWKDLDKSTCPKCKGEIFWDKPDYHVKESFNNRLTEALEAPKLPEKDEWSEDTDFWTDHTTMCVFHEPTLPYAMAWKLAIETIENRFGTIDYADIYQGLDIGPGETPWNQVVSNPELSVVFGVINDDEIEDHMEMARAETIDLERERHAALQDPDEPFYTTEGSLGDELIFVDDKWIDYRGGQIDGNFIIIIS